MELAEYIAAPPRNSEFPCYDLVRDFYYRQMHIELPRFDSGKSTPSEFIEEQSQKHQWVQVESPRYGTLALFRLWDGGHHVGVMLNTVEMLHYSERLAAAVVEPKSRFALYTQFVGYFDYVA